MIHVAFHFEDWTQHIGVPEPKSTIYRWCHNMTALGVSKIWMIDCTTFQIGQYYNHLNSDIEFERVTTLEEVESAVPDLDRVYLEVLDATESHAGSIDLTDFVSPDNVLYVVGRDTSLIPFSEERNGENCHWVHIPMAKEDSSYHAEIAMCIALWKKLCDEMSNGE